MRAAVAVCAVCCLACPVIAGAGNDQIDANQVKAAFLFNFAKFVYWTGDAGRPLVIGVAGDEATADALRAAVQGKSLGGRALQVRSIAGTEADLSCQIMFISTQDNRRTAEILNGVGRGTLTVGETAQFLREGGMIRLFMEGNRLRFQVNQRRVEEQGLKINSQLLSLAAR